MTEMSDQQKFLVIPVWIFFAAISLGYVFLEIRWGLNLIHLTADPDATREAIDAMVEEGRLLAAFGIAFSIWKGMLVDGKLPWVVRCLIFTCIVGLLYFSIGKFYDGVIKAIPAKESLSVYQLAAYRSGFLKGEIIDDDLEPLRDDPLAISSWPMIALDSKYLVPVSVMYERRRDIMINTISADITAKGMADYNKKANDLERLRLAMIESEKASRKFDDAHRKSLRTFARHWCGMRLGIRDPEAFARELLKSQCSKDHHKLGHWYLNDRKTVERESSRLAASPGKPVPKLKA